MALGKSVCQRAVTAAEGGTARGILGVRTSKVWQVPTAGHRHFLAQLAICGRGVPTPHRPSSLPYLLAPAPGELVSGSHTVGGRQELQGNTGNPQARGCPLGVSACPRPSSGGRPWPGTGGRVQRPLPEARVQDTVTSQRV